MTKPTFFITFPQKNPILNDRYCLIPANTYDQAMGVAFRELGSAFSFLYEGKDELERQEDLYRIRPISLERAIEIINRE